MTDRKSCLIILDADQLLDEKESILSHLDWLYHSNKNLSIIYLFQKNITESSLTRRISPYTTLFQNISVYSYFDRISMSNFFNFREKSFKVKIPDDLKAKILENCGGSPWLTRQAIRHLSQAKDEKEIFSDEAMKIRLNILYQELSDLQKTVIEKILKENYQFVTEEKQVLEYLLKTGLLIRRKSTYKITIPIFEKFLQDKINSKLQIRLNSANQIILDDTLIDSFFSRREKKVLKLLIKNHAKIVSREELAGFIWGNESYSDWALDQLMKRLRNKLVKLGLDRKQIKTLKNQGFFYS